jgi:4-oxalocrotonate tautomerase
MPHVIVKLAVGKSEQQKIGLTEAIVKDLMNVLDSKEENISVALEEIEPKEWTEKVYKPDIKAKWENLYKKPGYAPAE